MNQSLLSLSSILTLSISSLVAQTAGNLTFERWTGITGGSQISLLKENGITQRPADTSQLLAGAATAQWLGDNYGARLRGTVTAPVTGSYTFFIASDDHGELWFSETPSGMDKKLIAWNTNWTNFNQWGKYNSQRSHTVNLQAGQKYYIEALMKEGGGGDHLSIGWAYETPVSLQQTDIGTPVTATWTENNGVLNASVVAGDLWGTSDHCSASLRSWSGDGEFIARISSINNPHAWAKAGLTIRGGTGADAQQATIMRTSANGMAFQRRKAVGGATFHSGFGNDRPWVKLIRRGDSIESYISADGVSWKWIATDTLDGLPSSIQVGFAASNPDGTAPVEATFSDFSAAPLTASEVIPSAQLTSFAADPTDANGDNLPDAWQSQFPITGTAFEKSEFGDPDGDLVSNLEESQLGTDPNLPSGRPNHWLRETWTSTTGYDVADLILQDAFFNTPDKVELTSGSSFYNGYYDGTRARAVLTAPETGEYTFWVSGSGGSELWLSTDSSKYAKQRIAVMGAESGTGHGISASSAAMWDTFASQMSQPVHLVAGQKYFVEVLGQNGHVVGDISLAWARPNSERETFDVSHIVSYGKEMEDADDDYLPDAWETQYGLSTTDNGLTDRAHEGENGDFDEDGLNNRLEYLAGTDPTNADTDGDGINDAAEINSLGTDPLTSDAPAEIIASTFDLGSFSSADYNWSLVNGSLLSDTFRGAITWNFTAPSSGTWIIQADTTLRGNLRANETVHVNASIDGQFVGRYSLKYGANHNAILRIISPTLSAGNHTLTLMIDNLLGRRMVQIDSITLRQPSGIDTDGDGIPDWIETQLAEADYISGHATSSRTSPFCLEGRARLRDGFLLNGLAVQSGGDSTHWYADLPLLAGSSTSYTATFANGQTASGSIDWQATNVLDGETLTIRKGDRLKLKALPGGTSTGLSASLGFGTVNCALNPAATATQSTSAWGGQAIYGIDGITATNTLITHTEANTPGSWWQVDFGSDCTIEKVVLWNRQTNQSRMSNYRISVLNAAGATVASQDFHTGGTTHTGASETWQLVTPATGRSVKVELLGTNNQGNYILNFAELQAFGTEFVQLADDNNHIVRQFNEAGTQTVTATHANGNTGTLTVNVLQAAMPDDTAAVQNAVSFLTLQNDQTSPTLYFEGGQGLDLGAIQTINSSAYKFRLYPRKGGQLGVVARLWENGPILDVADVNSVTLTDALQNGLTTAFTSEEFPGYNLVTTPIVVLDLPPGGRIEITIFRAGVTFLDGTMTQTLYACDFTNGLAHLKFLYPQGMAGGYCHYIDIYGANGQYLGRR